MKASTLCVVSVVVTIVAGATFIKLEDGDHTQPVQQQDLFAFVSPMDSIQPDEQPHARHKPVGPLVVDARLRQLFDHHLAALSAKGAVAVRQDCEKDLDDRLDADSAAAAKRLLSRYLGYRESVFLAEENVQKSDGSVQTLRAHLEEITLLRARYFSASEAESLFAGDDSHDPYALVRLDIYYDAGMSDLQKAEQIAALQALRRKPDLYQSAPERVWMPSVR